MTRKLKRKNIDRIDREILRFMYGAKRPVSGHHISKKVRISPPSVRPHLNKLRERGIVKPAKIGNMRTFKRTFEKTERTINAPSRINWILDIKPK